MEAKSRPLWSHKGDFGTVLVVGGSELYTGASIFNGLGALRGGADLAILVGHPRAMNAAASYSPDLITFPLKGDPSLKDLPTILKLAQRCDAAVLGGGMASTAGVHQFLLKLISKLELPMVLDAEALRVVAKNPKILKGKKTILTPHAGEFQMLTGDGVRDDVKDRERKVKLAAAQFQTVILLKGHVDVISDGHLFHLSAVGSPYMTKGGTGDILAGVCAAFLAQKETPMAAAFKATEWMGKVGEKLGHERRESLLSSEILEAMKGA